MQRPKLTHDRLPQLTAAAIRSAREDGGLSIRKKCSEKDVEQWLWLQSVNEIAF